MDSRNRSCRRRSQFPSGSRPRPYPRIVRPAAAAIVALAFALAVPAAAAPPGAGVLVPGRSLGGIELGATKAAVKHNWGRAYGICQSCRRETWYFNYYAFEPRGAGVELERGRVVAVFTIYSPGGWSTPRGLSLGDPASRVRSFHTGLGRVRCHGYDALVLRARKAVTAFYVLDDRLWGFGLSRRGLPLCR
jgi:hypothetical protein